MKIKQDDRLTDWLWLLGLFAAAMLLYSINLGGLPLRDWDEGLVAQVAREIWRSPPHSLTWLYPTYWGEPYLNKPPLMHLLVAGSYAIAGINEWSARLPGAFLTALSVPLLYSIGREALGQRIPAVFAALVYLTFLPVVRHGRLAMLDGAVLCFMLLMVWCLLRSRRDSRYSLGIGIGFGLICLTKGVMLGLLLGAIALIFLLWDTPRLITLPYLWAGIGIGSLPVALWYGAQWLQYGQQFLGVSVVDQSFRRIWTPVENHVGPPWYYILELLKYGFPWLLFLPLAFKRVWQNRTLSWAKLVLVWSGVYLMAISLMATKLPWYILPLYPALALAVGAQLAQFWGSQPIGMKQSHSSTYSRVWIGVFALFAVIGWVGSLYFAKFSLQPEPDLEVILASVGVSMTTVAVLIARQNPQFLSVLIWGSYLSLLLLMTSEHWVWEIAEAYPVKPVAEIVQQGVPTDQRVYTSYPYNRPSLNFYSDRRVIPASQERLLELWNSNPRPYFLLDSNALRDLKLQPKAILNVSKGTENWILITKEGS
ncbi:glycosyltransferase family 39 protein [Leptolyngbya sp. FACHB-541]|uniref:ArnT family glycosyltransferase n=1 Tax=Leptolyngbya sp. FACHB-541 TaxID=2692810 RepID=UPI001686C057|nr:glycosyltransferase family 39 protein [Leptolyngbya sp. FACHB-541]MBD1995836.1 glycosyltransferase family 39 protein [Leptolyngbya sp. FACHB-541]